MKREPSMMVRDAGRHVDRAAIINSWDTYDIDEQDIWVDLPGFWKRVSKILLAGLIGSLVMLVAVRAGEKPEGGAVPVVSIEYVSVSETHMETLEHTE